MGSGNSSTATMLVTGAGGFVGAAVVRAALAANYRAFDEALAARVAEQDIHPTGAMWGLGELRSRDAVRALCAGFPDEYFRRIEAVEFAVKNDDGAEPRNLPKADLVVKRVEAFREQPGAAQHYYPGTPDGSRPGTYYVHLSDVSAMPKTELEVIAYHEGLPGHHMQISIAQELTGVPTFDETGTFRGFRGTGENRIHARPGGWLKVTRTGRMS